MIAFFDLAQISLHYLLYLCCRISHDKTEPSRPRLNRQGVNKVYVSLMGTHSIRGIVPLYMTVPSIDDCSIHGYVASISVVQYLLLIKAPLRRRYEQSRRANDDWRNSGTVV